MSHGVQEFWNAKGLTDHRCDLELSTVALSLQGESARNDDDWQANARLANPLNEFYAREARHFIVGDEQIVVLAEKRFPSLFTVGSGVHLEAVGNQNSEYEVAHAFVVVRDEDSSRADRDGRS